jgi:hypothetical protein
MMRRVVYLVVGAIALVYPLKLNAGDPYFGVVPWT